MIWNGWVLALIIGETAIAAINAIAFIYAFRIIRYWDTSSLSARQLDLEHRSEMIATVVSWSLLFQICSLVVFEITTRSLAPFIPGAMCTTGALQANALGWPILFLKMGSLFLYGWWIVIHHVDIQVEGFPLTSFKSWYMICLFPVLLLDLFLQVAYFTGLDPSVISSCCGVIFEVGGAGFGSSVASLPPKLTRGLVVAFVVVLLSLSLVLRRAEKNLGKIIFSVGSFLGFVLGMAGVVAFVAPYVYMMPALHCPFIFLDQEYYNYGYLVYVPLFTASFLGTSLGILAALKHGFPSAKPAIDGISLKFLRYSASSWGLFLVFAYAPVVKFWLVTGGTADLFQVGY